MDSPLAFVGRNPGKQEDLQGRPFIGPAGVALDTFLRDSGLQLHQVYITNLAKCYGGLGDPAPDETVYDHCESLLLDELDQIKPQVMIPLGSDAYRRLTGQTDAITRIQGQVYSPRRQPVPVYFPLTHPSYWIRTPGYYESVILERCVPRFRELLASLELKV